MFKVEDSSLFTEDGTLSFATPIREVLEVDGIMVVRLGLMGQPDDINNVYGVKNGEILWRVQDMRDYNPLLRDPVLSQRDPYTRIRIYEQDAHLIIGTSFGGYRYLIDSTTGKIVGEESWVK